MDKNYIKSAIAFLNYAESRGGLAKARRELDKNLPALAPLAMEQYNELVTCVKDLLGLALGLGEDDDFFFEERGGTEICKSAINLLDALRLKGEA